MRILRFSLRNRFSIMNVTPQRAKRSVVLIAVALCATQSLFAANVADMRPALLGSGPNALVNLISTTHLLERGVQHGALLFRAGVDRNSVLSYSQVRRTSKGT